VRDNLWRDRDEAVGAVITDAGVFLGWIDVSWPSSGHPEPALRELSHLVPSSDEGALEQALRRARRAREAALWQCRFCGERLVPGHMHSADICQRCAGQELGLVR
jgi:hypothetical protein